MEGSLVEAQSATLWRSPPKNLPLVLLPPPPDLVGFVVTVVLRVVVFDMEETEVLPLRLVAVFWMERMLLSSSSRLGKLPLPGLDIFGTFFVGVSDTVSSAKVHPVDGLYGRLH